MDHILIVNRLFAGLLHPPFASVMKSTKVQTLGELRMRGTANWWAGLLICIHSWSPAKSLRRVCTWASYTIRKHAGVDTHPSLWLLVPSRYTEQVEVYKPVLISILACSLGFHYITSECRICIKIKQVYNWTRYYCYLADFLHVVTENVVTDGRTETYLRTKDSNPRCACATRVN